MYGVLKMNIGEKIFYLRTSKGFSQEEMADGVFHTVEKLKKLMES